MDLEALAAERWQLSFLMFAYGWSNLAVSCCHAIISESRAVRPPTWSVFILRSIFCETILFCLCFVLSFFSSQILQSAFQISTWMLKVKKPKQHINKKTNTQPKDPQLRWAVLPFFPFCKYHYFWHDMHGCRGWGGIRADNTFRFMVLTEMLWSGIIDIF